MQKRSSPEARIAGALKDFAAYLEVSDKTGEEAVRAFARARDLRIGDADPEWNSGFIARKAEEKRRKDARKFPCIKCGADGGERCMDRAVGFMEDVHAGRGE